MSETDQEPEFISQNGSLFDLDARLDWFRKRTEEARAEGAVLCRYSVHPEIDGLSLFEAWKTYPADQGDVRWQLVVSPPTPGV